MESKKARGNAGVRKERPGRKETSTESYGDKSWKLGGEAQSEGTGGGQHRVQVMLGKRQQEGVKEEEVLRRKTLFFVRFSETIYISFQDPPSPHPLQFQKWLLKSQ